MSLASMIFEMRQMDNIVNNGMNTSNPQQKPKEYTINRPRKLLFKKSKK